jgi:hypothetical protein
MEPSSVFVRIIEPIQPVVTRSRIETVGRSFVLRSTYGLSAPEDVMVFDLARMKADVLALRAAFGRSNDLRIDIDRRIMALSPDDPSRDVLWQELESALTSQRELVGLLAKSSAADMTQLRAKAAVLATLLRSGDAGGDPIIPAHAIKALVLSLADDIAGWRG